MLHLIAFRDTALSPVSVKTISPSILRHLNYLYQYSSLCSAAAVEVAVADGFGEVFGFDIFAAI